MKRLIFSVLAGIILTACIMFVFEAISFYAPVWLRTTLFLMIPVCVISMAVYDILMSKEKRKPNPVTDSVGVYLCGKPVYLDQHNLKDSALAMRDENGDYETGDGEQHFNHKDALLAAKKQGKRIFTDDEVEYISKLPSRWDNEKKGLLITFEKLNGGKIEILFSSAGYRRYSSGSLNHVGSYGSYWSASPYSSTSGGASNLYFYSGYVYVNNSSHRAFGRSVRCVRDIE